jgi:hypothetical protein
MGAEAEVRQLTDPRLCPTRYPRRRGSATIRAILAAGRTALTRSELEDRFLSLVDAAGLPRPEVNAPIELGGDWIEVDCLWRARRPVWSSSTVTRRTQPARPLNETAPAIGCY